MSLLGLFLIDKGEKESTGRKKERKTEL